MKSTPRRARNGHNVSQLHYARKGTITPEMEFVALRESMELDRLARGIHPTNCRCASMAEKRSGQPLLQSDSRYAPHLRRKKKKKFVWCRRSMLRRAISGGALLPQDTGKYHRGTIFRGSW